MTDSSKKYGIPKLNGKNWLTWSKKAQYVLSQKKLWKVTQDGVDPLPPSDPNADENRSLEKDELAKTLLGLCVEDYHLERVLDAPSACAAWRALRTLYAGVSVARIAQIRQDFTGLRLKHGESIEMYFARAQEMAAQLKCASQPVSDLQFILQIIEGLPAMYEVVKQLLNMQDQNTLTVEWVMATLQQVEASKQRQRPEREQGSAYTGSSGRRPPAKKAATQQLCFKGGRPGHRFDACPNPAEDRGQRQPQWYKESTWARRAARHARAARHSEDTPSPCMKVLWLRMFSSWTRALHST